MAYALDEEGRVVTALTAARHAAYTCLECGRPLELRRRPGQRPHFRHRPGTRRIPLRATTGSVPTATERSLPTGLPSVAVGAQACLGKTTMHLAAKRLLQEQVRQELEDHGDVVWHLRCAGVDGRCRDHATIPRKLLIEAWDAVELEVACGPFRFDVAVTRQGRAVFGFELLFRHIELKVSDAKAEATGVPWLELLAEDVLAFRPRVPQRPVGLHGLSPAAEERCEVCKDLAARLAERKSDDKARANTLAGDHRECRRCTGEDKAYRAEAKRVAGAWRTVLERARTRS